MSAIAPSVSNAINNAIPQSADGAAAPLSAPSRAIPREGGNSLGTFGVCLSSYYAASPSLNLTRSTI